MKKKIMVVDDEPDILRSVKQLFEGMDDYKVTCASSGIQCLELLENNEIPDLILLDIMMPEMNGWKTFDTIRENLLWKNIPVIFLTAKTDDISVKLGRFLATDYIKKPFDIEELKKRIVKVLKSSSHLQK
ncbi:MAG: response regulator [Thermoplasmatales archaeon]|nr:response regulator [Thermoplasmatales archaeon]